MPSFPIDHGDVLTRAVPAAHGRDYRPYARSRSAANGRAKPLIDAKRFERLDKFSGGEDRWKDWSFDFKITVKAQDARVERAMRMVERAGEMSMDELRMADADGEARG